LPKETKKKRQPQRKDSQMKKEEHQGQQPYLDNKVFTTINGVVVSILNLFQYEITKLKLFIANLISPYQDI
jgi:hypothetical protein